MAAKHYLAIISGVIQEVIATVTSAGAGDDGKIVALDGTGRLDNSVMPTGIGPEVKSIVCVGAVAAGDFLNIYNDTGTAKCRKADATTSGKRADGFCLSGYTDGQSVTVYTDGINTQCTGLTPGPQWLSTSAGLCTGTAPSSTGNVVQSVGVAISATEVAFTAGEPVTLA